MSPSWNGTSVWDWSRANCCSGRRSSLVDVPMVRSPGRDPGTRDFGHLSRAASTPQASIRKSPLNSASEGRLETLGSEVEVEPAVEAIELRYMTQGRRRNKGNPTARGVVADDPDTYQVIVFARLRPIERVEGEPEAIRQLDSVASQVTRRLAIVFRVAESQALPVEVVEIDPDRRAPKPPVVLPNHRDQNSCFDWQVAGARESALP